MLASYAVIMRRSAMIAAPAALVMLVVSAVLGGGKSLLGSALGVAVVAGFFGLSTLVVSWVARRKPHAAMAAALVTYLVKIVLLLFFVARFLNTTAFSGEAFGLTAIGCVLVWTGAQAVTSMRLKVPYVEPDGER